MSHRNEFHVNWHAFENIRARTFFLGELQAEILLEETEMRDIYDWPAEWQGYRIS